jgi:hypothetical protein
MRVREPDSNPCTVSVAKRTCATNECAYPLRPVRATLVLAVVAQVLPFCYANFIKFVLVLYVGSFPFSIAVEMQWATPAVAFCAALIFLSIDRVGAVMDTPFADSESFGIDLEKRIRRTDKETSALVAAWLGKPIRHLDLFPGTARENLPRHLRREAAAAQGSYRRGRSERFLLTHRAPILSAVTNDGSDGLR